MILEWQKIMRYALDNLYQTDTYPLKEDDILIAIFPLESQKLEKHITGEQCQLIEQIKTLSLTKSDNKVEEDITIPLDTEVLLFDRKKIKARYNPKETTINLAVWLNSIAPIDNCQIALINKKDCLWEYVIDDMCDSLEVLFRFYVSVNSDAFDEIFDNWLKRQNIVHLCEVNEVFDTYLTSINFSSALASYEAEDIIDNQIIQRKLQQKLTKSLSFFDGYGLNIQIQSIEWKIYQPTQTKESLTTKIEKNRKESPIDDLRYDQLTIKQIIDEK